MKKIYTLEINDETHEVNCQEDLFSLIRKSMRDRKRLSFNISWELESPERTYRGLIEHEDEIMAMLRDKKTYKDIANRYGVSMSTAAAYCNRSKMISHSSVVHTSLENRKKVTEAMNNVWFGAKRPTANAN